VQRTPQIEVASPTQTLSQLVVQQNESAAQIDAAHALHVVACALPMVQTS
jgi:hypothetical protein